MVRLVNLNRKLKTPADKAVFQGKNPSNKTTGPNTAGGLQDPWRGTLDTNPLNDDFYQSSYTFSDQASGVQQKLDGLQRMIASIGKTDRVVKGIEPGDPWLIIESVVLRLAGKPAINESNHI